MSVVTSLSPWSNGTLSGWDRIGESGAQTIHFLHGNGFCSATLAPIADHLPHNWNLLFTDLLGHGNSAQPNLEKMPDWRLMAKQVGDAIEERHAGPVIGVGHSLGGMITLLLASERPHLFSRIVLLDPIFFSPDVILAQSFMRHTGLWKHSKLVKHVAARRRTWPSADALLQDLQKKSLYKKWHPDALTGFVFGGTQEHNNGVSLSCNPQWEASIFGSYPKGLWKAVKQMPVPMDVYVASRSYGFIKRSAERAARINSKIRWHSVDGTHCFPMEKPEHTAPMLLNLTT